MSIEMDIITAVVNTGLFDRVRYIVATAESENVPVALPIFVLSDGGRDYTAAQTFCGTPFCIQTFNATIWAETAAECRSLFFACKTVIDPIANVTEAIDSYDDNIGAYTCELTIVS